jgi:aminoglycoside phosphotransferase (APT) family kinase protein
MTGAVSPAGLGEALVRAELERLVAVHTGKTQSVDRMELRPSPYGSTAPLHEVDVILSDGARIELLLKRWFPPGERTGGVRPEFVESPVREIRMYEDVLIPEGFPVPTPLGSVVDAQAGRFWLFLERVRGVELYQVGPTPTWEAAARWLVALHAGGPRGRSNADACPLVYDRPFYERWMDRALAFIDQARRTDLELLVDLHADAVHRLLEVPPTLIHGEYYPSNVLVEETDVGERILPVDWEAAAVGPGVVDLAALTSGSWGTPLARRMEDAYFGAASELTAWGGTRAEFDEALAAARLHLAIQWLGWSEAWVPPAEHARDWLDDALELAGIRRAA